MNSKIFSLLFLLALFMTACNDDKIIFFENHVKEEDNGGSETTVPRLFEVINLDYPGLEKVKAYYDKKDYVSATSELFEYYRNREDVTNPNINLGQTSIGDFNKNIADQALEYRFYIKDKYIYCENVITKECVIVGTLDNITIGIDLGQDSDKKFEALATIHPGSISRTKNGM